jgi:alpha-1,2-mannosyltransferase
VLGISGALGAAIKIQPGIILAWALLTRRWRAVVIGGATLLALAAASMLLAGVGAWTDFLTLLRTVSDPITTDRNLTPGAVAYRLGMSADLAIVLQVLAVAAAVAALLAAIRWCSAEASYLVAVIVSQLISPILWDHYALLLLLPTAYLLQRGAWWALAIPLVTAWPLVGVTPPAIYPVAFAVALVAVMWVGRRTEPAVS